MKTSHFEGSIASRARGKTRFYLDRRAAGDDVATIAAAMARTRQKSMALDLLQKAQADLLRKGVGHELA